MTYNPTIKEVVQEAVSLITREVKAVERDQARGLITIDSGSRRIARLNGILNIVQTNDFQVEAARGALMLAEAVAKSLLADGEHFEGNPKVLDVAEAMDRNEQYDLSVEDVFVNGHPHVAASLVEKSARMTPVPRETEHNIADRAPEFAIRN